MALILPIAILFIMYFVMIRPQRQRMREQQAMIRSAEVGDEIVTNGGVIGTIVAAEDDEVVVIEVDQDVELRIQRRFIADMVTGSDAADDVDDDEADDDADVHEGPISDA